jgi:hypothetical protein
MMEEPWKWLRLPSLKPTPYTFQTVDQTITKLVGLIKDLKTQFHWIQNIATFIVMKNNVLNSSYLMLLG